jgi:2-oxoglutarate ferredoxin oxidoreductase subunit gamma
MKLSIRITGVGGQGAITAGHLLGTAAVLYDHKEAVVTEGYSPYITGGWSRADVVISDAPIDYPMISKLDGLVTMYQDGLDSNLSLLKQGSVVLAEKRLVDPSRAKGREVIMVPATDAAESLGRKMLTNIVLLGALEAALPLVSMDSLKTAVTTRFPKAAELNVRALDLGYSLGRHMPKEEGGIPA